MRDSAASARRFDCAGVFFSEVFKGCRGEWVFLAAGFFHFGNEGVGVEVDWRLQLLARLLDFVLDAEPVEGRTAGGPLRVIYLEHPSDARLDLVSNPLRRARDRQCSHKVAYWR